MFLTEGYGALLGRDPSIESGEALNFPRNVILDSSQTNALASDINCQSTDAPSTRFPEILRTGKPASAIETTISGGCDPKIAIIGAGMAGMLMAIKLQESGLNDFVIYEKGDEVGGAWRDNTYPGLRCDVPAHMFTFSFEPNPDYSSRFAIGSEIKRYFQSIPGKYGLRSKIRFKTSIEKVVFDEGRWYLITNHNEILFADIVICASGILRQPKYPDIEGLDSFAGDSFHSASWNRCVPLRKKRVGLIGTGSTAVQITSAIASKVEHLAIFQRTPHWIFPTPNRRYSKAERNFLSRHPAAAKALRAMYSKLFQWTFDRGLTGGKWMQRIVQWQCNSHLKRTVKDRSLRQKLTPNFKAGCKRLILARGYYEAIQQKNVSLITEPIERIEPDGIRTADGNLHNLDVLLYATGFDAHQFLRPMQVHGIAGAKISELWTEAPFAHRSVSLPGFPNFFMLLGPQSPIGNYSAISVAEVQVNYLLTLIREIASGRCDLVEPKEEAVEAGQRKIQQQMPHTIWLSGCSSWYLNENGKTAMWPWSFQRFDAEMRKPVLDEYAMSKRSASEPVTQVLFAKAQPSG